MISWNGIVVLAMGGWFAAGCAGQSSSTGPPAANGNPATGAKVTGTVTYRQRIAMPPDAVLVVQLVDVSRADAAAEMLGEQRVGFEGRQVPIPFEIDYDPGRIDQRHRYTVQARILVGEELRFISSTAHPVITQGNPTSIDVVVTQVTPAQ
jgi:putative lipoprotein